MKIKTGGGGEIRRLALISVFQLFFPVYTLPRHTSALLAGISHGQFQTLRECFHSHRSQLHCGMIVSVTLDKNLLSYWNVNGVLMRCSSSQLTLSVDRATFNICTEELRDRGLQGERRRDRARLAAQSHELDITNFVLPMDVPWTTRWTKFQTRKKTEETLRLCVCRTNG